MEQSATAKKRERNAEVLRAPEKTGRYSNRTQREKNSPNTYMAIRSRYLIPPACLLQQYIPIAEMRSLTLPDGTKVQLNSKSTLLYPHEFTGDSRSVFLLGEANFKVKPDKKRPFIVKSNDLQITALGTEFNVSAYPESQEIATTLISGSIRVDYNNLTTSVILHPNEQFAYNRNNKKYDLSNPDMDDVTAWQRGELVLQKMTLTDIINVLERKYPYAFVYSIKNLKNDRFSFRFKDNAPLEEVMEIIVNVVGQMDYRIVEDKNITF